ncbi:Uncharacterized protein BP5553_02266 [Venustampulla echinocandica]|uniref:Casein kinase II beta 2 subunit n=1 Tax=Venustampulla echinocandica TaxID=2656787 RepID=A0A370U3D1_9HELO|nr:Uncharacterized protein BP5553_02266 [Venustampulla echinocandica]RDL42287.1 Uncharacterized protein BP5553_02266 [Venustampulla echinocandica]
MAPASGIWAPIALRVFKQALKKTSGIIRARITDISRPLHRELQPILVRSSPRQPIHPAARLRQAKGRWYTTHSINTARRFASTAGQHSAKYIRASFPSSATARAVGGLTTRAPFASTLRPNLTGGALPRAAGGYGLGGGRTGARYFSHTPAAPAQIVSNVSVAVRAFFLSGQKAQFDGTTAQGEKRYRAATALQEETGRKMRAMSSKNIPGSFIDFHISPTITALTPLSGAIPSGNVEMSAPHLNTEGFLDVLSVDFARSLQDFAATMNDLKRLAPLGDLPITLEQKSIIRVRFPGCGAETVEALCDEFGVQRGIIGQDEDFDKSVGGQIALMFPFAPTSEHTLSSPGGSLRSQTGHDFEQVDKDILDNPWLESYESMEEDSSDHESAYFSKPSKIQNSSSYEGVEGIYRFLEQCDHPPRFQ